MNSISKKTYAIIAIVIIIAAIVGGYYTYSRLVPSGPGEVRIGVLAPLTGTSAANGKHMADGAQLAVDDLNAAGGVLGKKVVLFREDTAGNPDTGVAGATRLIYDDKVIAIVGVYFTGVALAISPLIAQNKVIFMSSLTSSNDITKQVLDNYDRYKYIFRDTGNTTAYALMSQQFLNLVAASGANKTWVLVAEDLKWTSDLYDILKPMSEANGFKLLDTYRVPLGTQDFSPIIAKIKALHPNAVVHASGTTNAVVLVKQWKADPVTRQIPIVAASGIMASLDGVVSVQQSSPGVPGYTFGYNWGWPSPGIPASMQYAQKFQKAYGYPPDAIDMKTYEAVRIIAAAIEQAKSLSTDDIVKALEKIDYQGITGRIRFDRSHDPIWGEQYWTGVLVQWLPDSSAIVIYPPRIKTGNPILPIPNS